MGSTEAITHVALIGATGNLGGSILNELMGSGLFTVTVLCRDPTKLSLPASVKVVMVDYDSFYSVRQALEGQHAVISAVAKTALRTQFRALDAAIAAGVKLFIPSEYGADLKNGHIRAFPIYKEKVELQHLLEEQAKAGNIAYTLIFNNVLLDWALRFGSMLDTKSRAITLYDGGAHPVSLTRISTVAKAVVGVLTHPDVTRNRAVYIHDIAISQQKMLEIAQELTPGESWTIQEVDTAKLEEEAKADVAKGTWSMKVFNAYAVRGSFGRGYGGCFHNSG